MINFSNSGRFRKRRYTQMSEINVTPFVDVMLVLLVIFMITAPLLTVGVPINLPKIKAQALPEDQTPLAITINKDENIFLKDINSVLSKKRKNQWITFGINPNKPSPAYGYMQTKKLYKNNYLKKITKFVEKPSTSLARKFLKSESYCFNFFYCECAKRSRDMH